MRLHPLFYFPEAVPLPALLAKQEGLPPGPERLMQQSIGLSPDHIWRTATFAAEHEKWRQERGECDGQLRRAAAAAAAAARETKCNTRLKQKGSFYHEEKS